MSEALITLFRDYEDFLAAKRIREEVFGIEQGITEEFESDPDDAIAAHYVAFKDGEAVGTARVLQTRRGRASTTIKIQRVAVLQAHRNDGVGRALMNEIIEDARRDSHIVAAELNAQESSIHFYEHLGFTAIGDMFDEVGIPHQRMVMDVSDVTI